MRWSVVTSADAARCWDRDLAALCGRSVTQSFGWGVYKATQGWAPLRLTAVAGEESPVAMVQVLVRAYPCRLVIAWCPGGLAGPLEHWTSEVLDRIAGATSARQLYCRVSFSRERHEDDVALLRARAWTPPSRTVSAARTMIWNLAPTEEVMLSGMRGGWRHNLQRALKRNLQIVLWQDASASALAALFETMASYKDVAVYHDAKSLTALLGSLQGRIVVYVCKNISGTPIAMRACAVQRDVAWDLLAATSPEGRRCYASYAVFWALVRHCRALGVTRYDLSGVDPAAARGVYDFKRGTGAGEQECLGEWEWSTSGLLARAVNLRLRVRGQAAGFA